MVNQITIASFIAGSCIGVDHNCSQLCTRVSEAFVCRCFHGYKLARDGRTCFDINECMEYRPCHQLCRNTNGSFECACLDGYSLDKVSNTCIDNNECLHPSTCLIDGIKRVCINLPGSFHCIEEVSAQDNNVFFDTELLELPEEEYESTTRTTPSIQFTSTESAPLQPSSSPPPKCPDKTPDSEKGYNIGSAITSYQLNVIAGCFITAVGLIVVFVIVFIVVQWRRRRRMETGRLIDSAQSASPTSSSSLTTSPPYQWRRQYVRRTDHGSARRWRPYTRTDKPRDISKPATGRSPTRSHDKSDDVTKMAKLERINEGFNDDEGSNPVPAFV